MSGLISIATVPHVLTAIRKATGISTAVMSAQMHEDRWLMLDVQDDHFEGEFVAAQVAGFICAHLEAEFGVRVHVGEPVVSEGATIGLQLLRTDARFYLHMAVL